MQLTLVDSAPWHIAIVVASLLMFIWKFLLPGRAKTDNVKRTSGEAIEGSAPVRAVHTLLLDQLNNPRPVRTELSSAGLLQRRPEELGMELQELGRTLVLTSSSIVTVSSEFYSLCATSEVATIVGLLSQLSQVFIVVSLSVDTLAQEGLDDGLIQCRVHRHLPQIPRHRILICSSGLGHVAIVRQLSPVLHVDTKVTVAKQLVRHLRSVVLVDEVLASEATVDGAVPDDPVYLTPEGVVLMDSILSMLVVDFRDLSTLPKSLPT